MPVENLRTDGGQGVITICSGVLGAAEFIRAIRERCQPDAALRDVRYYITDHRAVTHFDMTSDDIVELTRISGGASLENPQICLATVVAGDLGFGIVRMWYGYAEGVAWRCRLFRDRAEAERWLREEVDAGLTFV